MGRNGGSWVARGAAPATATAGVVGGLDGLVEEAKR